MTIEETVQCSCRIGVGLPCFDCQVYQYLRFGLGEYHVFFLWFCECAKLTEMKFENPIYQETYDFVRQKPDTILDSIPNHFLDLWLVKGDEQIDIPYHHFISIYYAYKANKEEISNSSSLGIVEMDKLWSVFLDFQVLLQMEKLFRSIPFTGIEKEEIKIFDFANYNKEKVALAKEIIQLSSQLQTI